MPDRDTILGAVDRTDRRLRAARLLSDLVAWTRVVLAVALAAELTVLVAPGARGVGLWVAVAGVAAGALVQGMRLVRTRVPDRAAAALDRAAQLRDELRSAHWFISRDISSDWLEVLVGRAASSARHLDVSRLVPVRVPRRPLAAVSLLAVLLAGASALPLDRLGAWLRAGPEALTADEQARLDEVQRLLQELAAAEDAARRDRIEALLAQLRATDLRPEERLALLAELRRLIAEATGDADWRTALSRAGAVLETETLTRPVGDALAGEALDEAAARMRELAGSVPPDAGTEQVLERAARAAGDAAGGFGETLDAAAEALRAGDADLAKERLTDAARALDEMAGRRDREELGRRADREIAQLERAFGERFRSPGDAEHARMRAERQALESDDLTPEGAVPMSGDAKGRAVPGSASEQAGATQARGDEPGPPTPSASNVVGAVQPLGDAVARRQELLAAGKATGEAPGREFVDEDTRASRVTVDYQPVDPPASYDAAEPVTGDVVPWAYRSLVKTYFQIVGPRGSSRDR